MIKLCGSYGLKIPGKQEYSSESYHASAEIELAGTADGEGVKAALSLLWDDLKSAVEAQIAGKAATAAKPAATTAPLARTTTQPDHRATTTPATQHQAPPAASANRGGEMAASKKQIGFLLSLCRRHKNLSAEQARQWLLAERKLKLDSLTKAQAAGLIDQLQGK